MSKLVSIIIPCYNHSNYLKDSMEGLLSQDYKEIELLICDDCSPDNSYEVLKEYEAQLKEKFVRVEIMRNEANQGVTKTLNKLLAMAKGEYIKIIASDDILMSNAISAYMEHALADETIDIIICNGDKILDHEHLDNYTSAGKIYDEVPDINAKDLLEKIYRHNMIFAPGALVKYSVFERIGFYDEEIAIEDLEFWLRALVTKQVRFSYLDKSLILYRISENSMSSTANNKTFETRRIRFHKAEMEILKKYKNDIAPEWAASVILERIMTEKNVAVARKLPELEAVVKAELQEFDDWKYISPSQKMMYVFDSLKISLKKLIKNMR